MTPFEQLGNEIPPAPIEIPTPDLPPANFQTIGAQVAQGAKSQWDWSGLWDSLVAFIPIFLGRVIGFLLGQVEKIFAWLLTIVFNIWNGAESGTDAIAAAAVGGIFKTPISPGEFSRVGSSNPGDGLQQNLFTVITAALGANFVGQGAQPIGPSDAGASKFMQTVLRMAIEGWMQGWEFEGATAGFVKRFADLKDILERSLGLGRMARRVMAPPIKVFVTDPLTWLLNSTYYPTQLKTNVAIKEYIRGAIDLPKLTTILGYEGIASDQIPALVNDARPHLSVGQLLELVNSGAMLESDAIAELQATGWDNATALQLWQAEHVTRQHALAEKYVAAAEAACVARKITIQEFNSIVDSFTATTSTVFTPLGGSSTALPGAQYFTQTEAEFLKATAYFKRSAGQQLVPLGQALQMFEQGLIGLDDYKRLLVLHGFDDGAGSVDVWNANVDAAIDDNLGTPWIDLWELWAFAKEQQVSQAATAKANAAKARALAAATRLQKAQDKAAAAIADAEAKGVSIAKFETLVLDGLKTIPQYQAFLTMKGLAPDNVAAFTTVLQAKLGAAGQAAAATGLVVGGSKPKGLSLAQLETAAQEGFLTIDQFVTNVQELGYSAEDAAILGQVLSRAIATAKLKAQTSQAAAAALGERHVSLAQEENAVLLGLQTMDQYQAMLAAAGFAPEDQAILVGALTQKLGTAKAAAAKKLAISGAPGTRPLNLAQTEKLVRAGVLTTADYQQALAEAGYDPGDTASLMSLLNLVLAHDQHVDAAAGKSNALLTTGGLSLADIRTAVKLGVVDIGTYDAALAAAGVANADAAVLHASLAAELVKAASTAAAVKRVSALLEAQGENLDALEVQVLSGQLTVPAFSALLAAAGVTPSDLAGLTQLVTDRLANQGAVNQLTQGLAAKAGAKGLSLAQEAAAVKQGVKTLVDYQAFVSGLGYDVADTNVLVATEAALLKQSPPPPLV